MTTVLTSELVRNHLAGATQLRARWQTVSERTLDHLNAAHGEDWATGFAATFAESMNKVLEPLLDPAKGGEPNAAPLAVDFLFIAILQLLEGSAPQHNALQGDNHITEFFHAAMADNYVGFMEQRFTQRLAASADTSSGEQLQ